MQTNNIKIHSTKNEYLYAGDGFWVRNFTKFPLKPYDINESLASTRDIKIFIENELQNNKKLLPKIDSEEIIAENIIIVSDGLLFEKKQKILEELPKDIVVIGVNGSLKEWNCNRRMNYYVVNNPYKECMDYLPKNFKTNPRVIASTKTYSDFIINYKGLIYLYSPVNNRMYNGVYTNSEYFIDDYRNSICAAIGLAYHFSVKNLFLLCCDDVKEKEKPGMVKIENYWLYPQQITAHKLIDANLYWLKKIKIGYNSYGLKYNNANYIEEENIKKFFNNE